MTTYYARAEYIYDGGDTNFSIPFSYINKEHIVVLVNDTPTQNYTYLNSNQIRVLDTLVENDVVVIARNTPIDERLVVFSDTSILDKRVQNLSAEQVFDAIQEIYDNNIVFKQDTDKTLEEYKEDIETTLTEYKETVDSEVEDINILASEALTKADEAIEKSTTALTNSETAINTATDATSVSQQAATDAANAITISQEAESKADNAVTTATTANTKADSATTTANQASAKVDEFGQTIEVVIEAAEKIQELEGAVVEAKVAAAQATVAADNAVEAAEAAIGALDSKQDKFTVGTGLALENGVLSNTQTSANWGNITGNIENQADLKEKFDSVDVRIDELQTSKLPNATIIGTPHIEGSFVSGFSENNYLQFPFVDISQGLPFEIYFSFTTGSNITQQQNILDSYFGIALAIQNGKGVMALSSNGTSWDIGLATGTNTLLANTTYYAKMAWTGTQYTTALSTDGETYIPDMVLNSTLSPHKTTIYIGASPNLFGAGTSHPFLGTINFNGAKVIVDNIEVWNGYADIGFQTRANVSLSNIDEAAKEVIKNLASGGSWGLITGDISSQSDLCEYFVKSEDFNQIPAVLKETYSNGYSGYNIWSNGYCEQWGRASASGSVSLLKNFKDTYYNVYCTLVLTGAGSNSASIWALSLKVDSFSLKAYIPNQTAFSPGYQWKACGYLAQGEY